MNLTGHDFDRRLLPWLKMAGLVLVAIFVLAIYGQLSGKDTFGQIARKHEKECRAADKDGSWKAEHYYGQPYPCTSRQQDEAAANASAVISAAGAM